MPSLIQRDKTACPSFFSFATAVHRISTMSVKNLLGAKIPSINWNVCNWKQERIIYFCVN